MMQGLPKQNAQMLRKSLRVRLVRLDTMLLIAMVKSYLANKLENIFINVE